MYIYIYIYAYTSMNNPCKVPLRPQAEVWVCRAGFLFWSVCRGP